MACGFPDEQAFRRREDFSDRLHPDPGKTGNLPRLDEASGTIVDSIRLDELLGVTDPELDYVRDAPRLGELAAEAVPAGQGAGSPGSSRSIWTRWLDQPFIPYLSRPPRLQEYLDSYGPDYPPRHHRTPVPV